MELISFKYPDDREIEVGTEFVLDIEKDNVQKRVKVKITSIDEMPKKKRIVYTCDFVNN